MYKPENTRGRSASGTRLRLTSLTSAVLLGGFAASVPAGPLNIATIPLFLTTSTYPNVLVLLDNSNSMDEAPNGAAVGSDSPESKSEIARGAVRSLATSYRDKVNMGLMAYQQAGIIKRHLHNSPYDVSFDPGNYDPAFDGERNSTTKRFRLENPVDAGHYLHYNVALPFYADDDFGNAFCYTTTSNPFDDGEDPNNGPWDTYRCFRSKTGDSDAVPVWNNSTSESAAGFSSLWFTAQFMPTDSDLAQGLLDFGTFLAWSHVGDTWFANNSPGRGYLHTPIGYLDAAQAALMDTKLGTSQFTSNLPTDPGYPLQNAGLTPIEGSLLTAQDYFSGNLSNVAEGFTGSVYPLPESCDHDYIVMVTDGLPSVDRDGTRISDPAAALQGSADVAGALLQDQVETYVVGFALPYGVDPTTLDQIAVAGGTSASYFADDPASLASALSSIFMDIDLRSSSAASVALNAGWISNQSYLYQARFDSTDWSGQLLAYRINPDGNLGNLAWDAGQVLDAQGTRNILSYNPVSHNGIVFGWPADPAAPGVLELSAAQVAILDTDPQDLTVDGEGEARLLYLRGDRTNEGAGNGYRTRGSVLGDIVYSNPVYVAAPSFRYPDTWVDLLDPSSAQPESNYSTGFQSPNSARTPVLYVGANDGMLHAFRAADAAELFAYVPAAVFGGLNQLTSPSYNHRYFLDGGPTVADAYFSGGSWHTVLTGGLRAGGQGVFTLDVTDPNLVTEANASSRVLWEFSDADDPDLGQTYSQPNVVRLHTGQWAVVFGNGYNNTAVDGSISATGNAVLYIVDVETGNLIKKIDTGEGTADDPLGSGRPNGLATVAPVDVDGDFIVDFVYAGDLFGNLWRFDLFHTGTNQWGVDLLFTAKDATNTPQPITVRPEVGRHPGGIGYMVYFGTGQYFEVGDNSSSGQQTQTFYGIWDRGGNPPNIDRGDLVGQSIIQEISQGGSEFRVTSDNEIDWSNDHGWYLDLYNTESGNTNNLGERQVSRPVLRNGRIIFTTLLPSTDVCSFGGDSWLMDLDFENGGRLDYTPFDTDGNGTIDTADLVADPTGADGDGDGETDKVAVGGRKSGVGIVPTPAIAVENPAGGGAGCVGDCGGAGRERKYESGSTGAIEGVLENSGPNDWGRQSWREVF